MKKFNRNVIIKGKFKEYVRIEKKNIRCIGNIYMYKLFKNIIIQKVISINVIKIWPKSRISLGKEFYSIYIYIYTGFKYKRVVMCEKQSLSKLIKI